MTISPCAYFGQLSVGKGSGAGAISSSKAEYGQSKINIVAKSKLFDNISKETAVWMSHGDKVNSLSDDWNITSKSENSIISSSRLSTTDSPDCQSNPTLAALFCNF